MRNSIGLLAQRFGQRSSMLLGWFLGDNLKFLFRYPPLSYIRYNVSHVCRLEEHTTQAPNNTTGQLETNLR